MAGIIARFPVPIKALAGTRQLIEAELPNNAPVEMEVRGRDETLYRVRFEPDGPLRVIFSIEPKTSPTNPGAGLRIPAPFVRLKGKLCEQSSRAAYAAAANTRRAYVPRGNEVGSTNRSRAASWLSIAKPTAPESFSSWRLIPRDRFTTSTTEPAWRCLICWPGS